MHNERNMCATRSATQEFWAVLFEGQLVANAYQVPALFRYRRDAEAFARNMHELRRHEYKIVPTAVILQWSPSKSEPIPLVADKKQEADTDVC